MPSAFQNQLAAGQAAIASVAGDTAVTYCRGDASVAVTAVPGSTRVETAAANGMSVTSLVRDFLIARGELVLAGAAIEPARGDLVKVTFGEIVEIYEVAAIGGEKHFRPSGTAGSQYRIHTRQIGTEPVGPAEEPLA